MNQYLKINWEKNEVEKSCRFIKFVKFSGALSHSTPLRSNFVQIMFSGINKNSGLYELGSIFMRIGILG